MCLCCAAETACPAGSASPTASLCVAGKYALSGAGVCIDCPGGVYGSTPGASSATCSGSCAAGYACPPGSTSPTVSVCMPGTYSTGGSAQCLPCPVGTYGTSQGLSSPLCTAPCPSGTYGATSGQSTAGCSGECPAGFACGVGTVNATSFPCAPGTYSLAGSRNCTLCPQVLTCIATSATLQSCGRHDWRVHAEICVVACSRSPHLAMCAPRVLRFVFNVLCVPFLSGSHRANMVQSLACRRQRARGHALRATHVALVLSAPQKSCVPLASTAQVALGPV